MVAVASTTNERHGFHPGDPGGTPSQTGSDVPAIGGWFGHGQPQDHPMFDRPSELAQPCPVFPGHPWTHPSLQ